MGGCLVYFPGSTIGNFEAEAAGRMLTGIAAVCGRGGSLVIGIDLQKDPAVLEAAYNDARGVTAEFNLNLLRCINRELDADFQLSQFEHTAVYNSHDHRIEMYLISLRNQSVEIGDHRFTFTEGERICTEYSHKYTIEQFAEIGMRANLKLHKSWTDEESLFAVLHLVVDASNDNRVLL